MTTNPEHHHTHILLALLRQHDLSILPPEHAGIVGINFTFVQYLCAVGEPRAAWKVYRDTFRLMPLIGEPMTRAQLAALSADNEAAS